MFTFECIGIRGGGAVEDPTEQFSIYIFEFENYYVDKLVETKDAFNSVVTSLHVAGMQC